VRDGTLHFTTAGSHDLPPGDYDIPYQGVSAILLEPGTKVTHDALRLCARHGTALAAVGTHGTRMYASLPGGPDTSARARRHAVLWADPGKRLLVARRMYAMRLGELFPDNPIHQLRGMEGARARQMYKRLAEMYGVPWSGRRYDRNRPDQTDPVNLAINHASVAVLAAAQVAVAVSGAIPQLGFIHEDSGLSFTLDVADLYRDEVTLPSAFRGYNAAQKGRIDPERAVRQDVGRILRRDQVVAQMIERIKELIDDDDGGGDA